MNPWIFLCLSNVPSGDAPAIGQGGQVLTVVVTGAPQGAAVEVERQGVGRLRLQDPRRGYLVGTFRSEPARFGSLRVELVTNERRVLWDGMVPLGDRAEETVTFEIASQGLFAARVPTPPVAAPFGIPVDGYAVAWGWAGVGFGAVGLLVLAGRRGPR